MLGRCTRNAAAAATTIALTALVAPATAQAATAPACTTKNAALAFQVDRNAFGRDKSLRAIDFRPAGGTSATSTTPISLTVMRNGASRTLRFDSQQGQYRYRARRGEQARFMAVYLEDGSGYGAVALGAQQRVTIPLPVLGSLPPPLAALFPNDEISVFLPSLTSGGVYGSSVCARGLPLTVGEGTAARRARTRRGF